MDLILTDLRGAAESLFLSGDYTYLAMVAVALLIGVFSMRNFGQVLCVSLLSLVALAAISIVYSGATSAAPSDPATWTGQLESAWTSMEATTGQDLIGYLIVFAVAISVLFLGKSLLFRN